VDSYGSSFCLSAAACFCLVAGPELTRAEIGEFVVTFVVTLPIFAAVFGRFYL
jgi:predicted membrane metal-binding protein